MTMTETETTEGRPRRRHRRTRSSTSSSLTARSPRSTTRSSSAIETGGEAIVITAEVAQQIGDGRVRAICLKPTDGLTRGTPVRNLGRGLMVPVGDAVLGHVFNVIGEPLDVDPRRGRRRAVGHPPRAAARSISSSRKRLMFETGIKVIDLLTPVPPGRQDRPVRRRRRRQDGAHHRDDQPRRPAARRCVRVRRRRRAHS